MIRFTDWPPLQLNFIFVMVATLYLLPTVAHSNFQLFLLTRGNISGQVAGSSRNTEGKIVRVKIVHVMMASWEGQSTIR